VIFYKKVSNHIKDSMLLPGSRNWGLGWGREAVNQRREALLKGTVDLLVLTILAWFLFTSKILFTFLQKATLTRSPLRAP
jgi:hypothetical protein